MGKNKTKTKRKQTFRKINIGQCPLFYPIRVLEC